MVTERLFTLTSLAEALAGARVRAVPISHKGNIIEPCVNCGRMLRISDCVMQRLLANETIRMRCPTCGLTLWAAIMDA